MSIRPKVRNAALVGALAAAVTATAWATNASWVPDPRPAQAEAPAATEPLAVDQTLSPNESVVATTDAAPATEATPVAVADRNVAQPGIVVEDRRLTVDQRIQGDVMDRIANMRNVSGKVGVTSQDSVVRLTGYTVTAGQARRVASEARGVTGVKDVQNEIRARIGGSV